MRLPLPIHHGSAFPGLDLILFPTFVVILVTLVVKVLSLPPIIRWLGVEDDGLADKEERAARLKANQAALAQLSDMAESEVTSKADALQRLRVEEQDRIRQCKTPDSDRAGTPRNQF